MEFHAKSKEETVKAFGSDAEKGLSDAVLTANRTKYGKNSLTPKKRKSFFEKIGDAVKEPMLLILLFSFAIALGANLGKFIKTGDGDFGECFGILAAVVLSVSITLIMEGSSEKAFAVLNKIYDNVKVKVIRGGFTLFVSQDSVVVGDILVLESGDKIIADGRVVESNGLSVDESALTGESHALEKSADVVLKASVPLAERKNMVYSGTFVTGGCGKMVVTAVGDNTEIGKIAGELSDKREADSPLQHKLAKLGKTITIIGTVTAVIVFILSLVKLIMTGNVTFTTVQDLFISCIILIVAAVPEGLPTIVAVSLALNMIKLAKENALIKKMIATETAGAVSVICSDKTGTLTMNKMSVLSVCGNKFCTSPEKLSKKALLQNFICNSTAEISGKNEENIVFKGSGTECALLVAAIKSDKRLDYKKYRKEYGVISRIPFDSDKKYMTTVIDNDGEQRELVKGAPEKITDMCGLTEMQRKRLLSEIESHQRKAKRVLCFAHRDGFGEYEYDGYAVLADAVRPEVHRAVADCKKAGIKVKILTGDNYATAFAVAVETGIASSEKEVINASELEKLDDRMLKKLLPRISVIARSTPIIKMRVVKALKELGEVVAVTGDGINDAPAIKHADVGIAMGKEGSDITKEAADIVLLDDSFATIVKAISFGRNVYRNLQRFILFQLSVNLTALAFITVAAILGLDSPFNTLQLLWINVIMDGPPALTLGLESTDASLMELKPVARSKSIVSVKMLIRLLFNGAFMGIVLIAQYICNFLGAEPKERNSAVFTLFILFQLFNAFNSRKLGAESIFKEFSKNKIMLITFACTFLIQIVIVQLAYPLFGIAPMRATLWIKTIISAFSIVAVSEIYKLFYRMIKGKSQKKVLWRKQTLKAQNVFGDK